MPYATLADAWGDSFSNYNTRSEDMSVAINNPYKNPQTQKSLLAVNAKELAGTGGGFLPPADADLVAALRTKYQTDGAAGVLALLPKEMKPAAGTLRASQRPPVERTPGAWVAPPAAHVTAPPSHPPIDPVLLVLAVLAVLYFLLEDD